MREPTDEEREDARIETLERAPRRRTHSYNPTCGCDSCEPDDEPTEAPK